MSTATSHMELDEDISESVKNHLLRKACTASVSCEARTPRRHQSKSTGNHSDEGKTVLSKGKMEVFQINTKKDRKNDPESEEGNSSIKQETGTTNMSPINNMKESRDYSGKFPSSDVYKRLSALETSLSAVSSIHNKSCDHVSDQQSNFNSPTLQNLSQETLERCLKPASLAKKHDINTKGNGVLSAVNTPWLNPENHAKNQVQENCCDCNAGTQGITPSQQHGSNLSRNLTSCCLNKAAQDFAVFLDDSNSLSSNKGESTGLQNSQLPNQTQQMLYQIQQDMVCRQRDSNTNSTNTLPTINNFSQLNTSVVMSPELQQNCRCQSMEATSKLSRLNSLDFTKKGNRTNMTVVVDRTRLYVHKEVLSAWSNRWRHLVQVNSITGEEIVLLNTNLQAVLHLLEFIYGIHKIVSDSNVYSLLELADKFEIPKIKRDCETFLLRKDASMELLVVAQDFRLHLLYKKCLETMSRQELGTLERCPLFPKLNATTTASIYKAEILRLQSIIKSLENENLKSEQELRKSNKILDKLADKFEQVCHQWIEQRNHCLKHAGICGADFDYSCTGCNTKVHRKITRLCEDAKNTGSDLAGVLRDNETKKLI